MKPRGSVGPRAALLLGGAYGTLALARSLKGAGLDVWLITDETNCACYSSAVNTVVRWSGANDPGALEALEKIARDNSLQGSVLIPGADPEVRLVAQARRRLASLFVVMISDWEHLRWACDKTLAYQRAKDLGLGVPRVYEQSSFNDSVLKELPYPLVLKPSIRLHSNRFTADRAWRVDSWDRFRELYDAASDLVGAEQVIAQQLIPGGGENQLSYAGVWNSGEPVISFTARRLRQYPVEFARTSTYVETADLADVSAAAETFLRSIQHHGLVEIEFKRDARDGALKLLDVNTRPWNWLGLAASAGIDLGGAIASILSNRPVAKVNARAGVAWIFASRDMLAGARSGALRPGTILRYAADWMRARSFACFSWSDPIPSFVDLPLTLARGLQQRRNGAPHPERVKRAQL